MTSKEKTKSLVNKATTDDRNPPSGYLLKELSSRTMSIQECQTIEDLVIKKLAKNKPYVKYKALRIVKFLCENGSPNWRRAWQRNTDKLRDAQQFRGPPDQIYGDAPYQQVRKAAKDAMQAVFQQSQINSNNIKNRIKSIDGGSAYQSSSYQSSSYTGTSTFSSGSKGVYGPAKKDKAPSAPWDKKPMPGHGNTSYQPTKRTTTFEPLKSSGAYSNPSVLSGTNVHSRGKLDTRKTGKRKKGKAGGVWGGDEDEEEEEEEDYSNTYEDDFPASDTYQKPKKKPFGGNIKKKSKASSGQYEKRWVDDIVKSGGVGCKILDLPKYVAQFENLSKNHVLEYLDEKLEDSAWQKQGKALALIEALIKGKSSDDVIDYFSQSPENIQACQNAKKSILRRKANAIVEYLEIDEQDEDEVDEEEEEEPQQSTQQQQQQQQQQPQQSGPAEDLLGFGGGGDEQEEDDMFANMDQAQEPKQSEDIMGGDMFANMNQAPTNPPPANDSTDIMALMGDVNRTQQNVQQQQEAKRKKEKYGFLDDLAADAGVTQQDARAGAGDILDLGFGGNNNKKQTQSQQASTGSAFGFDLSGSGGNNTNQTQATQQVQQQSSGGSSAFGFDLGGSGGNKQPQQQTTQQQQSGGGGSSAFGFDLGGQSSVQQTNTGNQQTMSSMNTMNTMMGGTMNQQNMMGGGMNNMMTGQMLQQNVQNMNQMNQMMNQMQQMQINQNMMNRMGQMNPNMMGQQMMNQNQSNSFMAAMATVNNPAQQQRPQQNYVNHTDPFAQVMAGSSNSSQTQSAPQRAKKTGTDNLFTEFGLSSMQ